MCDVVHLYGLAAVGPDATVAATRGIAGATEDRLDLSPDKRYGVDQSACSAKGSIGFSPEVCE